MKKISFALVGAASLALAACGGSGDDSLGDNVNDNYEAAADNLESMADNTGNAAAADTLENQADALETEGDRKEEAIDDADVNATNAVAADAAVNAM
jgi:ABC-type glycerol-3-phosphate transport system substrate-binding protein